MKKPHHTPTKLEHIATDALIPYARNSRTHSPEQVAQIAASIREYGFTTPVLVDANNTLIAGHGRVMASQQLGLATVPAIRLNYLTDAQRRAYVIADNKLALNAGWDMATLAREIEDLQSDGYDLDLLGFGDDELEALLHAHGSDDDEGEGGNTDEDAIPEAPSDPITRLGDVWLLGRHRVMCGSSTDVASIQALMQGQTVDMVVTDPPYGVNIVNSKSTIGGGGSIKFKDKVGTAGAGKIVKAKTYKKIMADETTGCAKLFYHACLDAGLTEFIIFGGNYFTDFLPPSPCWLVWDKQNVGNFARAELAWCSKPTPVKMYTHLWNGMSRAGSHKDEGSTRVHPTQKPVGLFVQIFADFAFETCFDGFLGSGSTLIAAEKTKRTCYGMELDPHYCDIVVNRWQNFTGKKATLEASGQAFDSFKAEA